MTNPYILTIILYVLLAILGALDASLTSFTLVPWVNGLRWLRVHLITLGVLTQLLFAITPMLVAIRARLPRPQVCWDIWATLNIGILALLYGISIINKAAIFTGGTLIFVATAMLMIQLYNMRESGEKQISDPAPRIGRKFYIAGLGYFLLGIIIGTGLWMGWPSALQMAVPVEVHIHANNWGLMSLVFAGLLIDLYPRFSGRSLAWPRSVTPIFWMMTVGALGLVLGPWFQNLYFTVPGLLLHLSATIWLLLNVIKPLWGEREAWTAGMSHLVLSYFWLLAPVLVAPLIILGVPGFPGVGIEANAPQALIYGWVLQFAYALLPFLFRRVFTPDQPAKLGGNRLSLIAVNLGGVFLWSSIFITSIASQLHGVAYALWAISMIPIALELWRIFRHGMDKLEAVELQLT